MVAGSFDLCFFACSSAYMEEHVVYVRVSLNKKCEKTMIRITLILMFFLD